MLGNKRSAPMTIMANKRQALLSPISNKNYSSYMKPKINVPGGRMDPDIGIVNNSNSEESYNERKLYSLGDKKTSNNNSRTMNIEKAKKATSRDDDGKFS